MTFDKRPRLTTELTNRSEEIERALGTVEAADGTALYDAARFAIEERLSRAGSSRKVLVMVTDGEDTVSWTRQTEVLELALSHNVVVYALGVRPDGGSRDQSPRHNLEKLSRESGGLALFPKHDPAELRARFQELEQELRHQYTLAYAMPPGEAAFHRVEIKSADRTQKVRSRVGYYPFAPTGSGTGGSR